MCMSSNKELIEKLVGNPREALNIELKNWIDPTLDEGKSKIIKCALAMRNNNGGFLLIGFDDKTCNPIIDNAPSNIKIKEWFHVDIIQSLISKYSSEQFEIKLEFVQLQGVEFPVIEIPDGVKYPVATKSALEKPGEKGEKLIKENQVYIRSLSASGKPSSTEAKCDDYKRIAEICMNNREADIGAFVRRQLGGLNINNNLSSILSVLLESPPANLQSDKKQVLNLLDTSRQKMNTSLVKRKLPPFELGTWEAGLVIKGTTLNSFSLNKDFLRLVKSSNPNLTGWPMWLISDDFREDSCRPYTSDNAWEAFIQSESFGHWNSHFDFYRYDPTGNFYSFRILDDDGTSLVAPGIFLDYIIVTHRVLETLAVGFAFSKAMDYSIDESELFFGFRWTKLSGRKLNTWSNRTGSLWVSEMAEDDEIFSYIAIPLHTPIDAIAPFCQQVLNPLFRLFNGREFELPFYERELVNLLKRR
jgi:hypothetical protein